jgi:hypothetical protein
MAGLATVFLRNSVYAAGGVMGVLRVSSWLLRLSKCPFIGVRGISEGRGENGALEGGMEEWLVVSGAGIVEGIVCVMRTAAK